MDKRPLPVILSVLMLLVLLPASGVVAGCAQAVATPSGPLAFEPATAEPTPTRFVDRFPSNDRPDPAEEAPVDQTPTDDVSAPTLTKVLDQIVDSRTPVPTATPGVLQREVTKLVSRTGFARTRFLGLSVTDWISLAGSLLLVLISYLILTWLIRRVLLRIVDRIPTDLDDRLLAAVGDDIRWLVLIFSLGFATGRLIFLSADLKALLKDAYFVIGLFLAVRILLKLIVLTGDWVRERSRTTGRRGELEPLIVLLTRLGNVLVVVLAASVLLSHFGVNVLAFATTLGLAGLAISLAAKDTIADAISGFIILVDRPFRIGDRIELQGVGTWGDVADIGLHSAVVWQTASRTRNTP